MRIVDKDEFENLPKNTVYRHAHFRDGKNVGLGDLRIKVNDAPVGDSEFKINWAFKRVEAILVDEEYGYYATDTVNDAFIVYEKEDFIALKEVIDELLS